MKIREMIKNKIAIPLLIIACILLVGQQASALPQSVNVAIIGSPGVINGGTFPTNGVDPTSGLDFSAFSFTDLHPDDVDTLNLTNYDTVLLNVASIEMSCNINTLSAQAKADLVSFVGNGGKLIIYDSECSAQDYSWLPYSFTTNNPGPVGYTMGTLTIVEENNLSTSNPADAHYIDAATLGSSTDAVCDMNVMTTFDANWCLDMSGTNYNGETGPVHAYARNSTDPTKEGLIIYNGLDVDYMGWSDPTNGNGLEKIWLQELQQDFNPSTLPCGFTVVGIALTPSDDENEVGEDHTVTATLTDLLGNPQPGVLVTFSVISGPNAGTIGTCNPAGCTTDANGQVSFTYTGDGGIGQDEIKACFNDAAGNLICSQIVTKDWIITNQPPVADAGPDQVVEQDSLGGASVTLDGSGSSDDGKIAPLTYTWMWSGGSPTGVSPTVTLPMGLTEVTLTVFDGEYSDTDTVDITVQDTTAPVITCPVDVTVEQATADGTEVELEATATDICDADPTITSDAPAIFPLGKTTVTFTATDDSGNSASCSMTVTVVDTNAPEVACLETVNPHGNTIPGGKNDKNTNEDGFYELAATDICDAEPELYLMSIDVEATADLLGAFDPSTALGPYPSGYKVKYTEANGAKEISEKKIGSDNGQADAIDSHVTGPHDLVVFAMDDAGNLGIMTCLVPPPPK